MECMSYAVSSAKFLVSVLGKGPFDLGGVVLDVVDPEKPETWVFQNLVSWKGPPHAEDLEDPAERMRYFKLRGAQYAEPWRTAALGVPEDIVLPIDPGEYYLAPLERVDGERMITLAGDAAHPMLPRKHH
jgi:2-polyprenyl-6-methoxyphenol hydroxylase-like FAD-dependent oxidoreductase